MILRSPAALFISSCALVVTIAVVALTGESWDQPAVQAPPGQGAGQQGGRGRGAAGPITIRAARLLDGRGGTVANAVVEVQGSKITKIDSRSGPVTYDLGDVTMLPGMIDVHVHLN